MSTANEKFTCDFCEKSYPKKTARLHYGSQCSALDKDQCSFCANTLRCVANHVASSHATQMGLNDLTKDGSQTANHVQLKDQQLLDKAVELGLPQEWEHALNVDAGAFVTCYNEDEKSCVFSFESLVASMMDKKQRVIDRMTVIEFTPDSRFPSKCQLSETLVHCHDFEMGHVVPAANYRNDERSYRAMFKLSNIYAMVPSINHGCWLWLENHVRKLTTKWDRVNVFTGIVMDEQASRHLKFPFGKYFYKIIHLEREGEEDKSQVFLIPNEPGRKHFWDYRSTLGEVMEKTGLSFLWKKDAPLTWESETGISARCYLCRKTFASRAMMLEHRANHKDSDFFRCERGGCEERRFIQLGHLQRHIKTFHEKTQLFECTKGDCKKVYLSNQSLKVQIEKEHNEDKVELPCPQCGKLFQHETNLNLHVERVHIKIKKWECGFPGCEYWSITSTIIKNHRLTHKAKEKRQEFPCKYCDSVYMNEASLKSHIKEKHSGQPFKRPVCQYCGKDYASKASLKNHVRAIHFRRGDVKKQVKLTALLLPMKRKQREESDDEEEVVVID